MEWTTGRSTLLLCPYGQLFERTVRGHSKNIIRGKFEQFKCFCTDMGIEDLTQSMSSSTMQGTTAKRALSRKLATSGNVLECINNQTDNVHSTTSENQKNIGDFWYAAFVQSNCEAIVADQIRGIEEGFESWVGTRDEKVKNSRGKWVMRTQVILHTYVFFRLPSKYNARKLKYAPLLEVKKLSKVYGLVMEPNRPQGEWEGAHIPNRQLERLKFMLDLSDNPVDIETRPRYLKGDLVRVIRGNLTGLEGTVCRDDDGKTRIYITIDGIGHAKTEIARNDVEYISRRRGRPYKE